MNLASVFRGAFLLFLVAAFAGAPGDQVAAREGDGTLRRIAFGSCLKADLPQAIWEPILRSKPDLFIFLGDNIYGDTEDMNILRMKYAILSRSPGYRRLKRSTPILATWDDHDYGVNDGGADYPQRAQSQRAFLDFFEEPPGSERRKRPGVYAAYSYGPPGRKVQVILLDTRYFRSPLDESPPLLTDMLGRYRPSQDKNKTMLGAAQWDWLERKLREPADLRLIGSSIQVLPTEQKYEKWWNLPHERARLFGLIKKTGAGGVVFLSGDRHFAEIARLDKTVADLPYPLYEVTSSGMTHVWAEAASEINSFRQGPAFGDLNSGQVELDWAGGTITLSIHDIQGNPRIQRKIPLAELKPARAPGPPRGR